MYILTLVEIETATIALQVTGNTEVELLAKFNTWVAARNTDLGEGELPMAQDLDFAAWCWANYGCCNAELTKV